MVPPPIPLPTGSRDDWQRDLPTLAPAELVEMIKEKSLVPVLNSSSPVLVILRIV